jgi:general secretion pathway protein A
MECLMYCEFYQLSERPFNVTPDPKFLYLNARYREALASLNYGITQRKGFITLIGEAGTGKTTLLNKLLEDLDPKTKSVFIFNTNVTFEEILEYIFAEFDLPVHNGKKLYMLQRLNTFLLEELRAGSNVALLIDEAQDLEFSVLEDLRLLSNLETAKEKILQIVLSGQPELGQKLSNPMLRQLRQRIGINCRLLPLSRDEITEYIQYRLQAAGCPDLKLFSREAEEQIYHFSRGIPRLVNVVCDNALVIGYALGKKRIGADVITEAAADLLSVERVVEEPNERPAAVASAPAPVTLPPQSRWRARLSVMGLVLVAAVVGLLSVGRTMLSQRTPGHEAASGAARQPLQVIRPGSQPQGTGLEVASGRPSERRANTSVPPEERAPADALPDQLAVEQPGQRMEAAPVQGAARAEPVPPAQTADRVGTEERAPVAPQERRPAEPPDAAELGERFGAVAPERAGVAPQPLALPAARSAAPKTDPPEQPAPPLPKVDLPAAALARADNAFSRSEETEAEARQAKRGEPRPAVTEPQPDDDAAAEPARSGDTAPQHAPRLDGGSFDRVVVRDGDSVSSIAMRKYGQANYTVLDLLKLANPEVRNINVISVGQTLRLPELGESFPVLNDGAGRLALLVYSTSHAVRASALQNALRARGFDAHVSGGSIGEGLPTFRVVVSGFADRGEVDTIGKQLQKLFREDTRIAQLGE